MDPGRELDAKVAELIGWRWYVHAEHVESMHPGERFLIHQSMDEYLSALVVEATGDEPVYDYRHASLATDVPRYSADIAAAFEVVDWMRERGWDVILDSEHRSPSAWTADFEKRDEKGALLLTAERDADELSEAICTAFVAAMEAEQ